MEVVAVLVEVASVGQGQQVEVAAREGVVSVAVVALGAVVGCSCRIANLGSG